MANGRKKGNKSKRPREAATYRHPEAERTLRPEIGMQAQFRKIVLMLQEGSVKSNL